MENRHAGVVFLGSTTLTFGLLTWLTKIGLKDEPKDLLHAGPVAFAVVFITLLLGLLLTALVCKDLGG